METDRDTTNCSHKGNSVRGTIIIPQRSCRDTVQDHTWSTRVVVRSVHLTYRTCGEIFEIFCVPYRPSFTPFLDTPSPSPKLLFFSFKKQTQCQKNRDKHWKQSSPGPVKDTRPVPPSDSLTKGLPYGSSRTGDQWSLEKDVHGETRRK